MIGMVAMSCDIKRWPMSPCVLMLKRLSGMCKAAKMHNHFKGQFTELRVSGLIKRLHTSSLLVLSF